MSEGLRLILTDIDGTILPYGQRVVSERMRDAFRAARAAGIRIGPASGRGFRHIPASFAGERELCETCLAANGMQVYLDGELVHQEFVDRTCADALVACVRDIPDAGVLVFEQGMPLLICGRREHLEESFPVYARQARMTDELPAHDLEKVNVFVAGGHDRTRQVLGQLAHAVCGIELNLPMPGFLNVVPTGWSKVAGIDLLCERLSIGRDQVAVFGDGGNDVEMLESMPLSFAVAGAVPEAAAAARYHIGRVEDDAVADVIFAMARGEWQASLA